MKRRMLMRGVAGLLAGGGLAGCTGAGGEVPVTAEPPPPGVPTETAGASGPAPSDPPGASAVSISDFGGQADADGTLVVTVTVTNESDRQQVRLVRATVSISDLQTSGERFVSLAPRETRTVRIHLDVSFDAWNARGSLTPQVIRRTPATPIPTDRDTPTETATDAEPSPTPTATEAENETGSDSATGTTSGTATD